MATKRDKAKEKLPVPPDFATIRETVNYLQAYKFDISYDGLSYYRKLGIIPNPTRFKGHMDKYYFIPDLWAHITTAKLLTNIWNFKLEDLPFYITILSTEAYLELPRILLKVHSKIFGLEQISKRREEYWNRSLYDTLCIGMKKILNKAIENVTPKKTSSEELNGLIEKEARNYIKTRSSVTLLTDPY